MGELIKNFFIYGLGGVLSKLVTFLLLPIITARLSPAEYGYFDLILSISSIAAILGMLSLETGFQRQYYLQPTAKDKDKLISTVLYAIIFFSCIVAAIVFCLIPLLSRTWFGNGFKVELGVACVEILATNVVIYLLCVLRYDDKPKLYSVVAVTSALLNALLSIVFVVALSMGVMGALLGSVVSQCLIAVILLFVIRGHLCVTFDKNIFKAVSSYSLPMLPARIGSVANTYANRFLMISLFSAEMIGLYSLSVRIASVMTLVHSAFQYAWNPYIYKILNQEGHKPVIIAAFKQCIYIIALVVIIVSLFSKELVLLVSNEQYIGAASIVGLLCLYNGIFLVKETTEIGVKVTGKSQYITYAYFGAVAVNFALLFVLPKLMGLVGIALSLLCSNIFLLYVTIFFSNKLYKIDFPIILLSFTLVLVTGICLLPSHIELSLATRIFVSIVLIAVWVSVNFSKIKGVVHK